MVDQLRVAIAKTTAAAAMRDRAHLIAAASVYVTALEAAVPLDAPVYAQSRPWRFFASLLLAARQANFWPRPSACM